MTEFYKTGGAVTLGILWLTFICGFIIPVSIRLIRAFVTDSPFQPNWITEKLDFIFFDDEALIDVALPFIGFSLIGLAMSMVLALVWPLAVLVFLIGGGMYFLRWAYRLSVKLDKLDKPSVKEKTE